MSKLVYVHPWGRRGRSYGSNPEPERPQAFTNADYNMLYHAVESLAHTQLGCLYDDFTASELGRLFIPESYRQALTTTFSLHADRDASSEIYFNVTKSLTNRDSVFGDDGKTSCYPANVVLRVQFDRETMPDGFTTPTPLCGAHHAAIEGLRGMPDPELHDKFISTMQTMVMVAGQWATVKWVLMRMHHSLRTPVQVRYVWPAIYSLAHAANLKWAPDVATASARAGNNAVVPPDVMPYLKPSYEVVAMSNQLGIHQDYVQRYRSGQLRLVVNTFTLNGAEGSDEITGT